MIERHELTPEIELMMSVSMQGENDYFRSSIKNRECQLWEFIPGTFVITRLEVNSKDDQKTLVICCYEGARLCLFAGLMIEFCIEHQIDFIRTHNKIPKLGRILMSRYNFKKIETRLDNESVYLLRV